MTQKKKKEKIEARRAQVKLELVKGSSILEISIKLGISVSAVKRDKAALLKEADAWLLDLPKGTVLLDYKAIADRTRRVIDDLEQKYFKSDDIFEKTALAKELRENEKFLMQFYDGAAAIYTFRKMGEGNVRAN